MRITIRPTSLKLTKDVRLRAINMIRDMCNMVFINQTIFIFEYVLEVHLFEAAILQISHRL
ncbi:MAG: hypothetical protein RR636_13425 [Clostridium sp.]